MRCYWDPPVPMYLGLVGGHDGGAPTLLSTGVYPEVYPGRFCRHHSELRGDGQLSPGVERSAVSAHEGVSH
jgi:hypothetical protein